MSNQFNSRSYHISIIQNISYNLLLQPLKSYPSFWNSSVVIAHSSSVWSTDRTFLQMHVTFCEYLVISDCASSYTFGTMEGIVIRNRVVFRSVAVLVRKTWRPVFGGFARNVSCDVLIGWSARVTGVPELSVPITEQIADIESCRSKRSPHRSWFFTATSRWVLSAAHQLFAGGCFGDELLGNMK